MEENNSAFFAMMSRLRYIDRWELMRNSREENLAEHSLDVAMIAHALCVIGNKRFNKNLDAEHAALIAMYHDVSEIITGDMPTPVKYFNPEIKNIYKDIEHRASEKLINYLPDDMKTDYREILEPEGDAFIYERKLVKAADKLSAYIKCIEERKCGNTEFISAEKTTLESIKKMGLPEVDIFLAEFIPSYNKTLDELGEK
ncbi:MAG: 5'-deoxynucleotidase [Catonella sp.]|jgi:5'-deoxynucleotidase|nr:5'-deoxynucleotidase [Catonella sp.]MDY6355762.1 5'-deoxynucleotidase [Catonella sp.]